MRKYIYTYTQTHKHARVHALARAASSDNSLFSWYRGISFSRRSLSRSFLINLGGKETRGTRITARNEVAERGAETRRQVATSRVSLLSTVDERRYRFPRGPHMDDDDSRKKTRENRSHVSWRAKHFCGEDGFFFFFFTRVGGRTKKKRKKKEKKAEYSVFYIYHMLTRTPGTKKKVEINLDRSSWCDSDRITVCGIVVLASTIR